MIILRKTILMILLIFSLFTIINTVAAANYYVDNNTKHTDITNWIENDAKKGDNLIFTGPKYDLTDTIIVSKSINIKSENKTKINFKKNRDMFNVMVSGVNFDGLSLNYNYKGEGFDTVIHASGKFKEINIKNTDIKVNGEMDNAIYIENWYGNVTNCKININGANSFGIYSDNWVGNLVKSKVIFEKVKNPSIGRPILIFKWNGNITNSNISSYSFTAITTGPMFGKIYGSKIIS
jgi:hypothetical protein